METWVRRPPAVGEEAEMEDPKKDVGPYDHLNTGDPLRLPVDLDELADRIANQNFGPDRFLAALVRALERFEIEESKKRRRPLKASPLAADIREVLGRGHHW